MGTKQFLALIPVYFRALFFLINKINNYKNVFVRMENVFLEEQN